jgi:hypothetical protein
MTRFASPNLAPILEGMPLALMLEGKARSEVTRGPSKRPAPAAPKRPRGRPSKLTPAITRRLCLSLRAGLTFEQACARALFSRRTFHAWLAQGEDDWEDDRDTPHADFARRVRRAVAEFAIELVNVVRRGGPNWRVAARLLEKRFPEEWALGATRLRAQRLAARREVARGLRRGRPLTADDLAQRFDVLGPADCARLAGAR